MESAWLCIEVHTSDGKRLVRRDRSLGGVVVKGFVLIVLVIAVLIIILTGHPIVAVPFSLSGLLLKWLGK